MCKKKVGQWSRDAERPSDFENPRRFISFLSITHHLLCLILVKDRAMSNTNALVRVVTTLSHLIGEISTNVGNDLVTCCWSRLQAVYQIFELVSVFFKVWIKVQNLKFKIKVQKKSAPSAP